ncbi:hypothetical protein ACLRAE_12340 [Bordetella bronchiseptica]|uniref:Bbp15 n=1 Tax=Bordetella phage BPP-1 TaxID=2885909 RepID=Q775C9_BPBPP|nr:hypothetical protein [Bordetella bronchiseptica]NP_958684.1 hypothetical protein bbp15 [Bordetella phage BPP-1]AAR97681.1 Bbp15 [Bordetella phage BPP-1]KDB80724.1 hypothetical protein L495_1765 [Bordetella bronchiseptica CARE970018BB]KDB99927.1 hypothetical protein AZ23_1755 [Bordetella bronchiseptica E010]KDC01371.1 hypothetical protein AZ18_1757 [Bordetella bronchiseptica D993]WLS60432.1 hypothetical protein RAK14_07070 [Bordetella bronchiseptica]
MEVIALKQGYFGKLREPGDKFDVPDGAKASWFAPASAAQHAPRAGKAPKQPADKNPQGSDDKSGGDLV